MPDPSGPSAFVAPVFPALLAIDFKIFGVYSRPAAIAIVLFDSALAALSCWFLYKLGMRIFEPRVAILAAAGLAVYPSAIWHSVKDIWDINLTVFCLLLLFDRLYGLDEKPSYKELTFIGAIMGFLVLVNPAPAICYPVIVLWIAYRIRGKFGHAEAFRRTAFLVVISVAVFVPWMIRNYIVLGLFSPRSTMGIQIRLGNNDRAWQDHGEYDASIYPPVNPEEMKLFVSIGEAAYDRYCARIGLAFIRENPKKFLDLIRYRFEEWWAGSAGKMYKGKWNAAFEFMVVSLVAVGIGGGILALWHRKRVALIIGFLVVFPIPYYLLTVVGRYRFPVEPFLILLASYALVQASVLLKPSASAASHPAS